MIAVTEINSAGKIQHFGKNNFVSGNNNIIPDLVYGVNLLSLSLTSISMVEIGLGDGDSTVQFLDIARQEKIELGLTGVDWFMGTKGISEGFQCLRNEEDLTWYSSIKEKFNPYCAVVMKSTSEEASNKFENESLDMVYIDASHMFLDVVNDIKCWFPKVKVGGVICGHDYELDTRKSMIDNFQKISLLDKCFHEDSVTLHYGVARAVDLCFPDRSYQNTSYSWFKIKE